MNTYVDNMALEAFG